MDAIALTKIIAPQLKPQTAAPGSGAAEAGGEGRFADLLQQSVERLDALENHAEAQVQRLLLGEDVELHQVVLAGERAGLALELAMSVRNKVVDAYQEVMRMQV
jgi:flagellar hook-basal body complex protein FliE